MAAPVKRRNFSPITKEYYKARLDKALEEKILTPEEAKLIKTFIEKKKPGVNISIGSALRQTLELISWRRFISQSYTEIDDIAAIDDGITSAAEHYKAGTLRGMVATLKTFLTWLARQGNTPLPLEDIHEIKLPKVKYMTVQSGDLLTKDDIEAMIKACQNSRDRALISVLSESACRIKELATLTWNQVEFDDYGAILNIMMKTEKSRYIRLLWSYTYLASWRADYPGRAEGDAPVFITLKEKAPLSQSGTFTQIKRIADRAGIKDKVRPHIFRHSRITELLRQGVSEQVVKKLAWGGESRMISTYGHLVGEDIDRELMAVHGLKPREKKDKGITVGECPNCQTACAAWMEYCPKCGHSFTAAAMASQERAARAILSDPELLRKYADDLEKKGRSG